MKRKLAYTAVTLSLALTGSTALARFRAPSLNINVIDRLRAMRKEDRLLVFAPHCDDETLGAGGLLIDAQRTGAAMNVVLITNGDNNFVATDIEFKKLYPSASDFLKAGEARQKELLAAMRTLGVPRKDLTFLCYPDRGIKALYTTNWPSHHPFRSRGTKDSWSPYQMCYEPGAVYSGENLYGNIKKIMSDFQPTIVVSPHPEDRHPDHKYSYEFIMKAAREVYAGSPPEDRPTFLAYLIHHRFYPRPKGLKPEEFLPPPISSAFAFNWVQLPLDDDDRDRKYDAIRMNKSQIVTPELGRLMRSFVRKNELFEKLPIE